MEAGARRYSRGQIRNPRRVLSLQTMYFRLFSFLEGVGFSDRAHSPHLQRFGQDTTDYHGLASASMVHRSLYLPAGSSRNHNLRTRDGS